MVDAADVARTSLRGEYMRISSKALLLITLRSRFGLLPFLPLSWSVPALTKVGCLFNLRTVLSRLHISSHRGMGMANWQKIGSFGTTLQHVYRGVIYTRRSNCIGHHRSVLPPLH